MPEDGGLTTELRISERAGPAPYIAGIPRVLWRRLMPPISSVVARTRPSDLSFGLSAPVPSAIDQRDEHQKRSDPVETRMQKRSFSGHPRASNRGAGKPWLPKLQLHSSHSPHESSQGHSSSKRYHC
jgi:hypothetical protein